jgi:diguanylate cyclase (GGDEF)-like protein
MNPPASASPVDDRVELERIRIFFGHAAGNMVNVMIGAVLIVIVLRMGGVSDATLAAWFLPLAAVCAGVPLFERHVKRVGIDAANCRRLRNIRIGFGAVMASFYGIAGFLLPESGAQVHDTFLFIIVSAMVMVATLGYTAMPLYYLVLDGVSLLPLTLHFALTYAATRDQYYLLLLVVAVVWQAVVLVKARRVSATTIGAIELNWRLRDEIAEHDRTKESIRHMALHDVLTGLANRRYFEDMLARALSNAMREGGCFGLVLIDLDGFKPVNDRYGHAVGDVVLKAVAGRLLGIMRAGDFCARIGGDEFTVILGGIDGEAALIQVADKIRAALAEPVALDDGRSVAIGASVGHAICPDDGPGPENLVAVADRRMYQAKQSGKASAAVQ